MSRGTLTIGVIGGSNIDEATRALAENVGRRIARAGARLICGGLGGVMEAACKGANEAGGVAIGILPDDDAIAANVSENLHYQKGRWPCQTRNAWAR